MKQLLTILAMILALPVWSQPAGLKNAHTVAENFYALQHKQKSGHALQLYTTDRQLSRQKSGSGEIRYYIFNDGDNGFIIVAGDRRFQPVLGYSTESRFDTAGMPENIRWWMHSYCEEMDAILNDPKADELSENPLWQAYLDNSAATIAQTTASVEPLIQTKWSQGFPYNDSCPYDANATNTNYHAPSGCVATAMAQILYFWKHPVSGKGFHTYTSANYGTVQSVNLEKTTYDWNSMTATYDKNSGTAAKRAVAQLMYHCGVSVEMDYGTKSSGAYTYLTEAQKKYYKATDARDALQYHFDCDTVIGYKRNDFTDSTVWINMLKKELDLRHPIMYSGSNSQSGHAFVCDGYDNRNFFHFNWGWAGTSDGYFQVSALDPRSQGIGGSNSGYNQNQNILFVHPVVYPASTLYKLNLYRPMHISTPTVKYNTAFSIADSIANIDTVPFNGYVGVAVYNENGTFFGVFGKTALSLGNGYYRPDFTCDIAATEKLTGGNYIARLVYTTANDRRWHLVGEYFCPNSLRFSVSGGNTNFKLLLYSPLRISQNPVQPNTAFQFRDSIANLGGTDKFEGQVGIAVYDSAGTFKGIFGSTNLELDNNYFRPNFTWDIPANNGLAQGSYTAAIVYKTEWNESWYLIGNDGYPNSCAFRITNSSSPSFQLQLSSQLTISQNPVEYNSAFNFTGVISNKGNAIFNGFAGIALFDAQSDLKGLYGTQGFSLGNGYSVKLKFNIPSDNNLPEGTYTALVLYTLGANQTWEILKGEQNYNQCVFRITRAQKHTLSAIPSNQRMGSVTGGCEFYGDTTVRLTATPNPSYRFLQWKDGVTDNPRTVTVSSDTVFIAQFAADDAIAEREITRPSVYATQGEIIVKNAEGLPLRIYDITGRQLHSMDAIAHDVQRIQMETPGVYIVRIGNDRMQKVLVP
jgi:hypothetical protein